MEAVSLSDLVFFHSVWRALSSGSAVPRRPALPTELVRRIIQLTGFLVPAPELNSGSSNPVKAEGSRDRPAHISAEHWFATAPFTRERLATIGQMRMKTVSRTYARESLGGYCLEEPQSGSWSWFEVAICPSPSSNSPEPKITADGTALAWVSHKPPAYRMVHQCTGGVRIWRAGEYRDEVPARSLQDDRENEHTGRRFGPDHTIWSYLEEDDVLAIRVCAQYPRWSIQAQRCELQFWKFFEPTIALHGAGPAREASTLRCNKPEMAWHGVEEMPGEA